jgi:hypothetical protein
MDCVSVGGMVEMNIKNIIGFGDSFILGSEIENNDHGNLAWPGLIANRLGINYSTTAIPGCGNEYIALQVYKYFSENKDYNQLAVINWTWSMRWDFYLESSQQWVSLGPTCVPGKLYKILEHHEAEKLINFYNDYVGESNNWNVLRSLKAMWGVQCFLKAHGIKSIQTVMDKSIFETKMNTTRMNHYTHFKSDHWPDVTEESDLNNLPFDIKQQVNQDFDRIIVTPEILLLQELVKPDILYFEGDTFLDWSYKKGFMVTELLHPLNDAHNASADLWQETYANIIGSARE